jgi:hypothetical protein
MTPRWWRWLGLLVLVPVVLVAGCASEGGYQGATYNESSLNNIPPSWYGDNPQLEQWYSPPYWMPEAD